MTSVPVVHANKTLFISGLPDEADEESLMKHLAKLDRNIKAKSVAIKRDPLTGASRNSAIIDFYSLEDAEKVLKMINFTELLGNEIKAMWFKQGGIRDKITGNIFVKGLQPETRAKELYDEFSKIANIVSCNVKYDKIGKCKGYGYVQFETKEAADKAIAEKNNVMFKGAKLELEPFKPRETRGSSNTKYNNLYIKDLPKTWTDEYLKTVFQTYGKIVSAVVVKDKKEDATNKGFGFVCYQSAEEAKKAEEGMKNVQYEGKVLYVARALPKADHKKQLKEERMRLYKDSNCYVTGFPADTTDEKLRAAFSEFGEVVSTRVMLMRRQNPNTGAVEYVSMGYGFVCFKNPAYAQKAKEESQKRDIMGTKIYVNIAENKEDRQRKKQSPMYNNNYYGMPMYRRPQYYRGRIPMPAVFSGPYPQGGYMPRPRRGGYGEGRMRGRGGRGGMLPMGFGVPQGQMMPPYGSPYLAGRMPMVVNQPIPLPALPTDKDSLGEILYPLVEKIDAARASKITGMLLEMEIEQIHTIIRNENELRKWVGEALTVLNKPGQMAN